MGCAVKQTMHLVGKTQLSSRLNLKRAQDDPYDNQIRAINIALGASGSVLCTSPRFSERRGLIFGSYKGHLGVSQSQSARFTAPGKNERRVSIVSTGGLSELPRARFGPAPPSLWC